MSSEVLDSLVSDPGGFILIHDCSIITSGIYILDECLARGKPLFGNHDTCVSLRLSEISPESVQLSGCVG